MALSNLQRIGGLGALYAEPRYTLSGDESAAYKEQIISATARLVQASVDARLHLLEPTYFRNLQDLFNEEQSYDTGWIYGPFDMRKLAEFAGRFNTLEAQYVELTGRSPVTTDPSRPLEDAEKDKEEEDSAWSKAKPFLIGALVIGGVFGVAWLLRSAASAKQAFQLGEVSPLPAGRTSRKRRLAGFTGGYYLRVDGKKG